MFGAGVGLVWLGLQDAESTVTISITTVKNVFWIILISIRYQELERIPAILWTNGECLFVSHFTYWTMRSK